MPCCLTSVIKVLFLHSQLLAGIIYWALNLPESFKYTKWLPCQLGTRSLLGHGYCTVSWKTQSKVINHFQLHKLTKLFLNVLKFKRLSYRSLILKRNRNILCCYWYFFLDSSRIFLPLYYWELNLGSHRGKKSNLTEFYLFPKTSSNNLLYIILSLDLVLLNFLTWVLQHNQRKHNFLVRNLLLIIMTYG